MSCAIYKRLGREFFIKVVSGHVVVVVLGALPRVSTPINGCNFNANFA